MNSSKRVSELEGEELDYWVAKAETGDRPFDAEDPTTWPAKIDGGRCYRAATCNGETGEALRWTERSPSQDWAIGGSIIEREGISVFQPDLSGGIWQAIVGELWEPTLESGEFGPTPLIAAMRAFVCSVFGEEVPDEV